MERRGETHCGCRPVSEQRTDGKQCACCSLGDTQQFLKGPKSSILQVSVSTSAGHHGAPASPVRTKTRNERKTRNHLTTVAPNPGCALEPSRRLSKLLTSQPQITQLPPGAWWVQGLGSGTTRCLQQTGRVGSGRRRPTDGWLPADIFAREEGAGPPEWAGQKRRQGEDAQIATLQRPVVLSARGQSG